MNSMSQRVLTVAVLATALGGLSTTAFAQGTPASPAATTTLQQAQAGATDSAKEGQREVQRAERLARMQKRMADQRAALKAELKINAEQEPAWNAFVARTAPEARTAHPGMRDSWSRLTTPQRLDKMATLKAERDVRTGQRHDAIRSFYAALNADQQKVFDARHMARFQRAGMGGAGHKHHHHHRSNHRMGTTL